MHEKTENVLIRTLFWALTVGQLETLVKDIAKVLSECDEHEYHVMERATEIMVIVNRAIKEKRYGV